jgi:hypothetical protein
MRTRRFRAWSVFYFQTAAAALIALVLNVSAARAQTPPLGTISGTVTSTSGTPIAGAIITATGPTRATAISVPDGSFSMSVPQGVYQITVDHGGFVSVSLSEVAVTAEASAPLKVTMSESSLSSLRTIANVSVAAGGAGQINTGPAALTITPGQAFSDYGNQQINDVLQQVPDLVVEHMGTQLDTSITVGGLQPYETQILIDGHPIALGQYGVWVSQFFPSYLVGGAETETGPGNTTPFANLAVGGTVNLLTPSFTHAFKVDANVGTDNMGTFYRSLIASGSIGKLGYVVGGGQSWNNSPFSDTKGCDLYEFDPATTANSPGFAGIVPFCGLMGGSFWNKAQIYKLRYTFSPTTSITFSFIGTYGGYSPQGYFSGTSYGPTLIEQCIPGTLMCTGPNEQNLVGKTLSNGIFWYPGTNIVNQQQLYTAEFRTSIGSGTLLERPYIATIEPESYEGLQEGGYPAFWGPSASMGYPTCSTLTPTATCYPGPPSLAPGQQIPSTGLANPNAFEATSCPPGSITSFTQINSPNNTIVSVNGQEECFQYPYSSFERDTLYGNTLSFIQPFGENTLSLTYDFHGQSTFAYANSPSNFLVPLGSAERFSTISLTGDLHPVRNLAIGFGIYDTLWNATGLQPVVNPNTGAVTEAGLDRTVARFDPHLAFIYRPERNTSIRLSGGTSETFPFIGELSGPASYVPPEPPFTAGLVSAKNPNLLPERSIAYNLGADHRFGNGSVLSVDLLDSVVHNVFQDITTLQTVPYNGGTGVLGTFAPVNVARLEGKVATIKYSYAPHTGFGYSFSLAADSSILYGVPPSAYNGFPGVPANNVQICGSEAFTPGLATCIPYLKGYERLTYAWKDGAFAAIGADYEGKNNSYFEPPMAFFDAVYRHPVGKYADLQISGQNIFNTNTAIDNLPAANIGVPVTGDYINTSGGVSQGKYTTYLVPAPFRAFRIELRIHTPG